MRRIVPLLVIALGALGSVGLTACDTPDQFFSRLQKEWNALQTVLAGGQSPLARRNDVAKSPNPMLTLSPSEAAARARQNSELLQEVLRVVYNREPENRGEFGTLLDTMNQGASIEGLYNGFTHSADYRKLEMANPGSTPDALTFFASELAETEALLDAPTNFGANAALPLSTPVQPIDTGVTEESFPAKATPSPSKSPMGHHAVKALELKYMVDFGSSSIFTLKRVLSDEMLKLLDQLSQDPIALHKWYGDWVFRMCSKNVDFGIPLRNKADAAFHTQWAKTADPDRLRWEVLNRIDRILNDRNGLRPPPLPTARPSMGDKSS